MFTFFLILLMIDGVVLTACVLYQAGQGGGLASLGGGTASQVLGGRAATTIVTKATWVTGGLFMAISLVLSTMSGSRTAGASDIQESIRKSITPAATTPAAPAAGGNAVGDLLNGNNAAGGGTAAPPSGTATPPATGAGGKKPDTPAVKKP